MDGFSIRQARLGDAEGVYALIGANVDRLVPRSLGNIVESIDRFVVAATATPYKFPETCFRAYGEDVLVAPPPSVAELEKLPIAQTRVCDVDAIDGEVTRLF